MSELCYCPMCGSKLPVDAPAGLCPQCLLKQGFESGVGDSASRSPTVIGAGFVPPAPDELAKDFPQLEILELIGKGGMGAVYKARQPALDRIVALKILPPEVGTDPAFAERFTREARALAKLSLQNIVAVYDFGKTSVPDADGVRDASRDGLYYFLMEYVDGANLRQLIKAGETKPAEALAIVPQICEALEFAHGEGVVHRDIKPENILVDQRGRVKIADFGLAKLLRSEPVGVTLTQAGQVMGTWYYMAPEQIERPLEVDHRADIYSLGVVFYEMLTGHVPTGRFEPPSTQAQIDVRLDEVVLRALEREPARRYQHASDVKTEVESICGMPHAVRQGPLDEAAGQGPPSKQQQTRGPGLGLVITGILNWLAIPLVMWILTYFATEQDGPPLIILAMLALTAPLASSLILAAGFLMMRQRAWWLCVVGSVLAPIITPGNLIGLPIGIWALVVLSQRDVREAFRRRPSNGDAGDANGGPASTAPAGTVNGFLSVPNVPTVNTVPSVRESSHPIRDFQIKPQPGFARWVGIPMLAIVATWLAAALIATLADRSGDGVGILVLGSGVALIPVAFFVLTLYWALRRRDVLLAVIACLFFVLYVAGGLWWVLYYDEGVPPEALDRSGEKLAQPAFQPVAKWTLEPQGPALTDVFASSMKLTPRQRTQVDRILQESHRDYTRLLKQHTRKTRNADGHLIVTVTPFPREIARFEEKMWEKLDPLLDKEQQNLLRLNLPLRPKRLRRGTYRGDSLADRGIFGFGGDRFELEIWKVGEWYHWRTRDPAIISNWPPGGVSEQKYIRGPAVPDAFRQWWNEP
jgi:predicted Ser/Thr protein kinase